MRPTVEMVEPGDNQESSIRRIRAAGSPSSVWLCLQAALRCCAANALDVLSGRLLFGDMFSAELNLDLSKARMLDYIAPQGGALCQITVVIT